MTEDNRKSKVDNARKGGPGKPKGLPKTGGRKKGTPNKNSLSVKSSLDAKGIDLIHEIITRIFELTDKGQQVSELKALLPYVYPRLKETDFIPDQAEEPTLDLDETQLLALVAQ
jgi:hypothetical protein